MPRPRSVSLLALALLALAVMNALGLAAGLRGYTLVSRLPLSLLPLYLLGSRAAWAVVFGGLAVGLWWLRQWGRRGTLAAVPVFVALAWIERLGFGRSDYLRETLVFTAGAHLVFLGLTWAILLPGRVRRCFSG